VKFRSRSSTRAFHTPARSRSSKYGLNASSLLGWLPTVQIADRLNIHPLPL
jgi:hypothetical protein